MGIGKGGGIRDFPRGTAELWNYVTRERVAALPDSGGHIAMSHDGKKLATGNTNKTTKIWDIATGHLDRILETDGVIAMAFSPDGRTLAASGWKSDVTLWDIDLKKPVGSLTNSQRHIWSTAYSPDGLLLATAGADQTIRLYDLKTRQETERLVGHGDQVLSLAFSPVGQTLASGSKDKTAMLWNLHPSRTATTVSNVTSRPIFSRTGGGSPPASIKAR